VNIGRRQQGRERAASVIDVEPDVDAILDAVARADDDAFRASLEGLENPYGDGHAGERIADVLANVPIDAALRWKQTQPVPESVAMPGGA
jgi:UDP-N-acetylglucosamine 2-epimerase